MLKLSMRLLKQPSNRTKATATTSKYPCSCLSLKALRFWAYCFARRLNPLFKRFHRLAAKTSGGSRETKFTDANNLICLFANDGGTTCAPGGEDMNHIATFTNVAITVRCLRI